MPKPSLVFDLDGTLCQCGVYYLQAITKFTEWKSGLTRIPADALVRIQDCIDVQQAQLAEGFTRHRFPRSFEATSLVADVMAGRDPNLAEAATARRMAEDVYFAEYELLPGTELALQTLLAQSWQFILVTKGDPDIQFRKITKNRLDRFFSHHFTHIVPVKAPHVLAGILAQHDVEVSASYLIGDSARDDMFPARENGLRTVQITGNHPWSYDAHHAVGDYQLVGSIADLPALLSDLSAPVLSGASA